MLLIAARVGGRSLPVSRSAFPAPYGVGPECGTAPCGATASAAPVPRWTRGAGCEGDETEVSHEAVPRGPG